MASTLMKSSSFLKSMSRAKAKERKEAASPVSIDLDVLSSDDEDCIYDRLTAISSAEGKILKNPHQIRRRRDSAGEAADALRKDLEAMGYDLECHSFITKKVNSDAEKSDRYPEPQHSREGSGFSGNISQQSSLSSRTDAVLAMRSMTSPTCSMKESPTKLTLKDSGGLLTKPPRFDPNASFNQWKVEDDWDTHCVVPRKRSHVKLPPSSRASQKAKEKLDIIKEKLALSRKKIEESLNNEEETDDEDCRTLEGPPVLRKLSGTSSPPRKTGSIGSEDPPMIIEGLSFVKSEESISPRAKRARSKLLSLVETREQKLRDVKNDTSSAKTAPAKAMTTPVDEKTNSLTKTLLKESNTEADPVIDGKSQILEMDGPSSNLDSPGQAGSEVTRKAKGSNIGAEADRATSDPADRKPNTVVPLEGGNESEATLRRTETAEAGSRVDKSSTLDIGKSEKESSPERITPNVDILQPSLPKKNRFVRFSLSFGRKGKTCTPEVKTQQAKLQDVNNKTVPEYNAISKTLANAVSSPLNMLADAASNFFEQQETQKDCQAPSTDIGCFDDTTNYVDYEIETMEGVEIVNLGKEKHTPGTATDKRQKAVNQESKESTTESLIVDSVENTDNAKDDDVTETALDQPGSSAWGSIQKVLGLATPTSAMKELKMPSNEPAGTNSGTGEYSNVEDVGEISTEKKTDNLLPPASEQKGAEPITQERKSKNVQSTRRVGAKLLIQQTTAKLKSISKKQEEAKEPYFPSLDNDHVLGPPSSTPGSPVRSVNSPSKILRQKLRKGFQAFRAMSKDAYQNNEDKIDPRDRIQDFLDSKLIGQEEHSYVSKIPQGNKATGSKGEKLTGVPSHLIVNRNPMTKAEGSRTSVSSPSKMDARIWDEIAEASCIVENAMKKLEPPRKDSTHQELQSVLSDEIERALLTLKKHADRFGVTESDLLLAVKSQDDTSSTQERSKSDTAIDSELSAESVHTMTIGQEILDVFKTYFDAK